MDTTHAYIVYANHLSAKIFCSLRSLLCNRYVGSACAADGNNAASASPLVAASRLHLQNPRDRIIHRFRNSCLNERCLLLTRPSPEGTAVICDHLLIYRNEVIIWLTSAEDYLRKAGSLLALNIKLCKPHLIITATFYQRFSFGHT